MNGSAKRLVGVVVCTVVAAAAIGLYIGLYLTNVPGSVAATTDASGAHLYLATVPAAEASDPHNTWVSFYAVDANAGNWRHDSTYVVPANTVLTVTIYQYDSASGLRNEFLSQATGTQGGTFALDGKAVPDIDPTQAAHGFAVPQWGLSVPLYGVSTSAKNPCSQAPCSLSNDHHTITFTIRTPGKGLYRWQCIVPCAAGFIQGYGGPMQTVGYMGGFFKVV